MCAGVEPLNLCSLQDLFGDQNDLLRHPGMEVIPEGVISEELQDELRRDLLHGGKETFYELAAAYEQESLGALSIFV